MGHGTFAIATVVAPLALPGRSIELLYTGWLEDGMRSPMEVMLGVGRYYYLVTVIDTRCDAGANERAPASFGVENELNARRLLPPDQPLFCDLDKTS